MFAKYMTGNGFNTLARTAVVVASRRCIAALQQVEVRWYQGQVRDTNRRVQDEAQPLGPNGMEVVA